jgi:hypothetical protein
MNMATAKTKTIKPAKAKAAPATATKPTKAKAAAPALTPLDVIKPGEKKRDRSGRKQQVYDMVTRKGVTFRALLAAAEKEDMPTDRVRLWVQSWVRRGYLAID